MTSTSSRAVVHPQRILGAYNLVALQQWITGSKAALAPEDLLYMLEDSKTGGKASIPHEETFLKNRELFKIYLEALDYLQSELLRVATLSQKTLVQQMDRWVAYIRTPCTGMDNYTTFGMRAGSFTHLTDEEAHDILGVALPPPVDQHVEEDR